MVKKSTITGMIAALSSIFIFKATTFIDYIQAIISEHPYITIFAMVALFAYREQIATKLGGT